MNKQFPASRARRRIVAGLAIGTAILVAQAACVGPKAPADSSAPGGTSPDRLAVAASEIAGTVRLYGCVVDGDSVEVRAQPLTLVALDGARFAPDLDVADVRTTLAPTTDKHLYRFSFRGLRPDALYRLQIRVAPPNPCHRLVWRAPAAGLALSGGPPVEIDGLAVRTTLAVRSASREWVGADAVPLDVPDQAVKTFRWQSTLPGVERGELQVSTTPFSADGPPSPCAEPAGAVIHRRTLEYRPDAENEFAVDVAAILGELRDSAGPTAFRAHQAGAPLSVRVVPITAEGPACDADAHGAPGEVALGHMPSGFKLPTEPTAPLPPVVPGDGHGYTPPYVGAPLEGHPNYTQLAYKVIRSHAIPTTEMCKGTHASTDPIGCVLAYSGAKGHVGPGQWMLFALSSSGGSNDMFSNLASAFGGLITEGVDAVGQFVTDLSEAWEDIKNTVAQVVVDVITWLPPMKDICDDIADEGGDCQSLVKAGIEVGLMAMGVPPSIPNWEELKQQGIDYLAAEIATQIETSTGVPAGLTEVILKEIAQEAIDRMTDTRGLHPSPAFNWIVPYNGFDPAVMTVTLRELGHASIPDDLALINFAVPLYALSELPIPTVFHNSEVLRVPIVLRPSLSAINPPVCQSSPFTGTMCTPQLVSAPAKCEFFSVTSWQWLPTVCPPHWLNVYYRDQWLSKFHAQPCLELTAAAFIVSGIFPAWSPTASFTITARVDPEHGYTWNGAAFAAC